MSELTLLLESIRESHQDPEAPPVMTAPLREWLENFDPEEEDVPELVSEWVARREELLRAGADVIERLEEKHRTPTFHDVVAGTADFPPWHGNPSWQLICFHPWAEGYEKALEDCKALLNE